MQLADAIKFSYLAEQLTATETQAFLNNLILSNSNAILKAFFSYFNQTPITAECNNLKEECIQSICALINSRKSQENKMTVHQNPLTKDQVDELPKCESFDELPRNVIGVVASFLEQEEFAKLSRSNKSVYLDCKTPPFLVSVRIIFDGKNIHKPMPNLAAYPQARELHLNLESRAQIQYGEHDDSVDYDAYNDLCEVLEPPDLTPSDALNAMRGLHAIFMRNDVEWTHHIMSKKYFEMSWNLLNRMGQRLSRQLSTVRVVLDPRSPEISVALCKFRNLRCLGLTFLDWNETLTKGEAIDLVAALSELQGFALNDFAEPISRGSADTDPQFDGIFARTLLEAFCPKLCFLELTNFGCSVERLQLLHEINFMNLQQLHLDEGSWLALKSILQSADNLRKVRIVIDNYSMRTMSQCFLQIQDRMNELFVRCKLLEYLRCDCTQPAVLDGIESRLRQTKQLRRRTLKIVIEGARDLYVSSKSQLYRIIELLQLSDIEDFMFILVDSSRNEPWISIDVLKTINSSMKARIYAQCHDNRVVFTNRDCKISGYGESWMM